MRLIISILTLLIAGNLIAQKPTDASALFDEGRFAEAADINRQLLKKKPKDAVLNVRLARCLEAMGNHDEAIEHYRMAAENGMSTLANMIITGKIMQALGEFDEEDVKAALNKVVSVKHPEMFDLNMKALSLSRDYAE